jgi:nicotinamide-nucleotide amidase
MKLEEKVGALLQAQGLTLATAESCTGGLVGHLITNVPGSSAYYLGGFVAYANEMKESALGVRHDTLVVHGTVSEETAREMAQGARRRLAADVAIAITGIAGPGGGTEEKPVGLVYVALSTPDGERFRRYVWQGDRQANKEQSAEAALQLLGSYLEERRDLASLGSQGKQRPRRTSAIEFVNEQVNVETRVHQGEAVVPVAFTWRGRRFKIDSWGRETSKKQGELSLRCYLVQTDGRETWELCHDRETAQWMLVRHWAGSPQFL